MVRREIGLSEAGPGAHATPVVAPKTVAPYIRKVPFGQWSSPD